MENNIHKDILVTGKVQGVWYRKYARAAAMRNNVTGYVMNLPNGNVYIEAEGKRIDVDAFIEWCESGPEKAKVDSVMAEEESKLLHYEIFDIRR